MKVIYIAGRYRSKYPEMIDENIRFADNMARMICQMTHWFPIIPHCNTNGWDKFWPNGGDEYFLKGTMELMKRCDAIFMLPGWKESEGARGELAQAELLGLPVYYDMYEVPVLIDENGLQDE